MKKLLAVVLVTGLLLSFASVALANRTVTNDVTWFLGGSGTADNQGLYAYGLGSSCTPGGAAYLQWDGLPLGTQVGYVKVTVTASTPTFVLSGTQIGIYAVSDNWDETTLMQNLPARPATNTALKTIPAPTGGGVLTFEGTGAGDPLVDYVNQQLAAGSPDQKVSFMIMFSSGCYADSDSTYNIQDKELTIPGGAGVAADLTITTGDPNAVDLRTFRSDDSAVTWPLYAGLGALGIIVALGIVSTRRKAN